jgi:uncharacterized protein (TIGR02145 family)
MHTSKKSILISLLLLVASTFTQAQVGVGTTSPVASAKLEIVSTTQGFLPPRMTSAQRLNILNPAEGLVVYDLTLKSIVFFNGLSWVKLSSSSDAFATISGQIWMNENLNVAVYADGTAIPEVTDPTAWANLTTGAWCWYNNDATNGAIYGKLYNWNAVADSRGLCPTGFHVPTDEEWTTLSNNLGGTAVAGGKMKSTGITRWDSPNTDATNSSGFSGLPGGVRFINANGTFFGDIGFQGFWWSSSESETIYGWNRLLVAITGDLFRNRLTKNSGSSVRCIKN